MGRPQIYTDKTIVTVNSRKARSKLHQGSERRAIINAVLDSGGRCTLADLDAQFGYDVRGKTAALIRSGWLEVV